MCQKTKKTLYARWLRRNQPPLPLSPYPSGLKTRVYFFCHAAYPVKIGKEYSFGDVVLMTNKILPFGHQIHYSLSFVYIKYTLPFQGTTFQSTNEPDSKFRISKWCMIVSASNLEVVVLDPETYKLKRQVICPSHSL